ncbi:MAG: ATP-binding protein [Deltaproteobacteria bacterium]|nr:ATP-binding protein [Deltaproteobacteria bacterium]
MKLRLPGRFELKILGAMLLVGVLSAGAGTYALQFYLKNFSTVLLEQQREAGDAMGQAVDVFRAYFDDRKDIFRARTEEIAERRPASLAELERVEGLLTARLLEGGVIVDAWEADPAVMERSQKSPPFLAEISPLEGESRSGRILELTFGIPREMYDRFLRLRESMDRERELDRVLAAVVPRVLREYLSVIVIVLVIPPLVGFYVARKATKRVAKLRDATTLVAAGDLTVRIRPEGKDELDELGRTFDAMVSEIAEARSRLEYVQKVSAWQEVARRLAHEIKNPLTPVQLAVQELVSKYSGDDDRYRRLLNTANEILYEEITGLRRLVDDFSAFAKLSRAEPVVMDLGVLVEEFVRQHPQFEKVTRVSVSAAVIYAKCDKVLFRRVLANLVENAVQAAEAEGRTPQILLTVGASDQIEQVLVSVEDNGPGVPPHERQRIFDPYVTHKEGGTGLGLAIVRKILIDHGGDIRVADTPSTLGGARFEVRIPAA